MNFILLYVVCIIGHFDFFFNQRLTCLELKIVTYNKKTPQR